MNNCIIRTNQYMSDIDNILKKNGYRICWCGEILSHMQSMGNNIISLIRIPIVKVEDKKVYGSIDLQLPNDYFSISSCTDDDVISLVNLDNAIPYPTDLIKENRKLKEKLDKIKKKKNKWKTKYYNLIDGKISIELARIESGLGIEPIRGN